jgi:flagellum-specific peptidoglycan hydrolase FlgJ
MSEFTYKDSLERARKAVLDSRSKFAAPTAQETKEASVEGLMRPRMRPEQTEAQSSAATGIGQALMEALTPEAPTESSSSAPETSPRPKARPGTGGSSPSTSFEGKDAFIERMTPVANEVAAELGISPKIILAQAALETGWGSSVVGNNFFGIKSHGQAGGVKAATHEVVNGKRVNITDSFRSYETPEDSIRGYGSFLKNNKRYEGLLGAGSGNVSDQLEALQRSGYATDPNYSSKLRAIMDGLPTQ